MELIMFITIADITKNESESVARETTLLVI